MVAAAHAGVESEAIATALTVSVCTVRRWLHRAATTENLCDLPRTGHPLLYSEEARLRLVAFYCQTRPLPNCGRWSLRWAVRHLAASTDHAEVGETPSKSTMHRILQGHGLKPHQSRYFLHITDPDFFPKMEHLVALYASPPPRLFFFDECPGIQILKRITPDLRNDAMRRLEAVLLYTSPSPRDS